MDWFVPLRNGRDSLDLDLFGLAWRGLVGTTGFDRADADWFVSLRSGRDSLDLDVSSLVRRGLVGTMGFDRAEVDWFGLVCIAAQWAGFA